MDLSFFFLELFFFNLLSTLLLLLYFSLKMSPSYFWESPPQLSLFIQPLKPYAVYPMLPKLSIQQKYVPRQLLWFTGKLFHYFTVNNWVPYARPICRNLYFLTRCNYLSRALCPYCLALCDRFEKKIPQIWHFF